MESFIDNFELLRRQIAEVKVLVLAWKASATESNETSNKELEKENPNPPKKGGEAQQSTLMEKKSAIKMKTKKSPRQRKFARSSTRSKIKEREQKSTKFLLKEKPPLKTSHQNPNADSVLRNNKIQDEKMSTMQKKLKTLICHQLNGLSVINTFHEKSTCIGVPPVA